MLRYFLLISGFLFSINMTAQEKQRPEITTYYFIRHAEKDVSDPLEQDAHLTAKGQQRALNWSHILQQVRFDAVYATHYIRTQETARPTADKNQIPITIYPVHSKFDPDFKTATFGKNVLIVGHNTTIPAFVNDVIGKQKYAKIEESNNSNLYIVTIHNGLITDLLLKID